MKELSTESDTWQWCKIRQIGEVCDEEYKIMVDNSDSFDAVMINSIGLWTADRHAYYHIAGWCINNSVTEGFMNLPQWERTGTENNCSDRNSYRNFWTICSDNQADGCLFGKMMLYFDPKMQNITRYDSMLETAWDVVVENTTCSPTSNPTIHPTGIPTQLPSSTPTTNPSYFPSANPSNIPTADPTPIPSYSPSEVPSEPSLSPSSEPSLYPSQSPTQNPSEQPTADPTTIPSSEPTSDPWHIQTNIPTANPSNVPTVYLTSTEATDTVITVLTLHPTNGRISDPEASNIEKASVHTTGTMALAEGNTTSNSGFAFKIIMAIIVGLMVFCMLCILGLLVLHIIYRQRKDSKALKAIQHANDRNKLIMPNLQSSAIELQAGMPREFELIQIEPVEHIPVEMRLMTATGAESDSQSEEITERRFDTKGWVRGNNENVETFYGDDAESAVSCRREGQNKVLDALIECDDIVSPESPQTVSTPDIATPDSNETPGTMRYV